MRDQRMLRQRPTQSQGRLSGAGSVKSLGYLQHGTGHKGPETVSGWPREQGVRCVPRVEKAEVTLHVTVRASVFVLRP